MVSKRKTNCGNVIRNWPVGDRPREKLLRRGACSLSNSELLAILLRTGTNGVSAVELARDVMKKFGTFRNMVHTDPRDWKEFKGLGGAKIAHILAALEIGRRFREDELTAGRNKIKKVDDVLDMFMSQMRDLKTEVFKVVYLDCQNKIIDVCEATCGTVDYSVPIVREIMHVALQKFAKSIICAHNHPSGNIEPSLQDRNFTRDLIRAGKIMGIDVLDHIIIGDGMYFSFSSEGPL